MCDFCSAKFSRRDFCGGGTALSLGRLSRPGRLEEISLRLPPQTGRARTVAVTLDACPGKFDTRIADTLVHHEIPATIFVTKTWMQWNPEALFYLKSCPKLFSLQNHGAQHLPPVLGHEKIYGLTPAGSLPAIQAEILDGAAAITEATGRAPSWYRGAAGLYSPQALPFITSLGFRIAGYSLNSDEGASLPARTVAARIAAARDGDVIEGHINQPHRDSGAGIAAGLVALQQSGTRFVKLEDASFL